MEETAVKTAVTTEKAPKADRSEKTKKASKEKKPSFFKGLKAEYKKIIFPDKRTVMKQTVAVVITSVFIGVLIAVLDLIMKFGLGFIL